MEVFDNTENNSPAASVPLNVLQVLRHRALQHRDPKLDLEDGSDDHFVKVIHILRCMYQISEPLTSTEGLMFIS